jgi:Carboxypeptidase regulatory-like domain
MTACKTALLILLLAATVAGQNGGAVTGTIVTAQGGVALPNATVRVKNIATGIESTVQSGAKGNFTLSGLAAGNYELTAELPPLFIPFQQQNVHIIARQTVHIDIRLNDVQLGTLGDSGAEFAKLVAPQPAPSGPAPRTLEGKPDLSGVWLPAAFSDPGRPEPLPWAESLANERQQNFGKDIPSAHCLPLGVPMMGFIFPMKFVQTPRLLVILDEASVPRQIFLDGRTHPADPSPSFMGHSVGHWEGTTLVVDTIGFNNRTWINLAGFPVTERLHVVERFRRRDLGHLETEITIDDPTAFKKPWKMKKVTSLAPKDFELLEYVCAENDRDREHLVGK